MTSKVSIALATFNGERFLQEQLDSLAGQSLQPFELVVSDDCSSDGTLRILQQFKQTTKFPMIINQNSEKLGYRHNFRRALQHCTGDLIAFCDQDDVWYANKLERTVPLFDNPRVMMVYHNAHIFDNSSGSKRLMLDASHENQLLSITPFPKFHFSAGLLQIFRKELIPFDHLWDLSVDHGENDRILPHDKWFFFLALATGEVRFIDEPLLDYRQHESNTYGAAPSATKWSKLFQRLEHFGEQDSLAAMSASQRAAAARALTEAFPGEAQRLFLVAECFEQYFARLLRRSTTYSKSNVLGRAVNLAKAIRCGDYGSGDWKFAGPSIARDLWSGVIYGRYLDPSRRKA